MNPQDWGSESAPIAAASRENTGVRDMRQIAESKTIRTVLKRAPWIHFLQTVLLALIGFIGAKVYNNLEGVMLGHAALKAQFDAKATSDKERWDRIDKTLERILIQSKRRPSRRVEEVR